MESKVKKVAFYAQRFLDLIKSAETYTVIVEKEKSLDDQAASDKGN